MNTSKKHNKQPYKKADKPNYKPRSPRKQNDNNKYKDFLDNPLKHVEQQDQAVVSLIKLNKSIEKIVVPVKLESTKFNKFIENLNNVHTRRIAKMLPIIMYRLLELVIKNRNTFQTIRNVFYNTPLLEDYSAVWNSYSFVKKIHVIISEYMKIIYKHSTFLGIAELIILGGIVLDDIPSILYSGDYTNLEDISVIPLAKQLAKKTNDVGAIYLAPITKLEQDQRTAQNQQELKDLHLTLQDIGEQLKNVNTRDPEHIKVNRSEASRNTTYSQGPGGVGFPGTIKKAEIGKSIPYSNKGAQMIRNMSGLSKKSSYVSTISAPRLGSFSSKSSKSNKSI